MLTDPIINALQLLVDSDAVMRARFMRFGLCDSIDNTGAPYPSAGSAVSLDNVRKLIPVSPSLAEKIKRIRQTDLANYELGQQGQRVAELSGKKIDGHAAFMLGDMVSRFLAEFG
jgi:hypothetical protein